MFNQINEAVEALKKGEIIIVLDDENRENEGDFVCLAEKATPEKINYLISTGRGLVCVAMGHEKVESKGLFPMVQENEDPLKTAFTVSVDFQDTTTGISAYERCQTIRALADDKISGNAFKRPGHIFPLKAKKNGVLERRGHTEGAVDLARLAGAQPVAVICEIISADGRMAKRDELLQLAKKEGLKIITIDDLVQFRESNLLELISQTQLPLDQGVFDLQVFLNRKDGQEHLALIKRPFQNNTPLVRMHSECLTGDVFGSRRCDCGDQLNNALALIGKEGGVFLYLRQEGRGIGLGNKIKAYKLQDLGLDTEEANVALGFPEDARDYQVGAEILKYFGVDKIRLMTNNPLKIQGLEAHGIHIEERIPSIGQLQKENYLYLKTKKEKMGHLLTLEEE